jgi:hypothetical protein
MKIKNKLSWRLKLVKNLILKGKFRFSDIFFIFLPNSALEKKKNREEKQRNIKIIQINSAIKIKKIILNYLI